MKTKHLIIAGMLGIALAGVIFTGCKKKSTADTDTTAAQDDANASFVLQDSKNISDGAAKGQANERVMNGTCGVATWDSSATTDTIDIHFAGTCTSPDGRVRKGDIIVYWAKGKGYFDSAATITETWKNYSVKTLSGLVIGVTGSRTLTNIGKDSLGDHSWSFTANLTLNYSTGGSATWSSTRTNVLQKIGGIWYYIITGSANGTSKSGVGYTIKINQPLYWTAFWLNGGWPSGGGKYCDCFEAGQIELDRSGKNPIYLTFTSGVGNCNHTAQATLNGNTYNITLP